jgi:hypothetical protein
MEIKKQSTATNLKRNSSTKISGVSANTVNRHKREVSYLKEAGAVVKKSVGTKKTQQCSECGEVALSMRTLKKHHLTEKPLCLVCWKRESKLKFRSHISKECFVTLTDVMKIESFRKLINCKQETYGQTAKRKRADDIELCTPHKFVQKEFQQTESSESVKRPRKNLRCAMQEYKKSFSYSQNSPTDLKNSMKQDAGLLKPNITLQSTPEVISSNRKSLDTKKTYASALRQERKHNPEVPPSGSKTRQKQRTRSASSKLSVTDLKPKSTVPYTCSVCLTKFSHLIDSKVHELKHCNRFPVLVLEHCKMPSSQVSAESNTHKAIESENLRQINGPDESEVQETSSTGVNTRSKLDKAVQVNFTDESEARETGSMGANTRIKQDKAVQVNFSEERENYRGRQNIADNKCGQEDASAGVSTENKYQEAIQINFAAEKVQQGLQTVTPDKNKPTSVNGGPVIESECEESVEAGVNEREGKDADEVAQDFNGSLQLLSLFNVKSSKANKNNDDEAVIGEAAACEFCESVQERDEGMHSSEIHTNEVQEAVGNEFHANIQEDCAEEEAYKMNHASESDLIDGKEAVENAFREEVAEVDDERGSYTDRAEINEGKEFIEHEYNENIQTDFAEDQERHFTNVTDINTDVEAVEREYHEDMPADDFEDDQGGNDKSRACINEAIKNEHHEGVETGTAEGGNQRGVYVSGDSNESLEAVESEYHVYTQADVDDEDQERHYTREGIMNEGKENVNSEDEDVPADTIEEDQEGKCTSEVIMNKGKEYVDSEDVPADTIEEDREGEYTSEVIMNEGKEYVDSEDEDVPADTIEEDQEGNCTNEAERNEVQEAVEKEFCEGVHVAVAEIVVHEGKCATEADVNIVQEPVETEFHEYIQYASEDFHRIENEGVEMEVHENIQVEGEEYTGRNYRIEFHTDEEQGFVNGGEGVDNIFPETIQGCVSYEREGQREIETHECDTPVDQESVSSDGTLNKFNVAIRDKCSS